jgi:hypothetical protein
MPLSPAQQVISQDADENMAIHAMFELVVVRRRINRDRLIILKRREEELGFSSEENDRTVLDELGEFTNLQHFMNLRKRYRSRSEREFEGVLQEAVAVKERKR